MAHVRKLNFEPGPLTARQRHGENVKAEILANLAEVETLEEQVEEARKCFEAEQERVDRLLVYSENASLYYWKTWGFRPVGRGRRGQRRCEPHRGI